MAELGLIASVVGVTTAALAASKALSDMIDQVRNAPEEIIAICKDTHSFHGIITNVQVAITDQFIVSKLETEQQILRAVRQLEGPLKNCGRILRQMRSKIKSHLKQSDDGGFRVNSYNMRWIFQRKDVMDCRNRLETTKSTLNAALSSVVFLCHMKMMGSLGCSLDVLPISGLDVDAGSALREYAESTVSPPDSAFESAGRDTELPAQGLSVAKQSSLEELRGLRSHTSKTADGSQALSDAPNSDLKAIASSKGKATIPSKTHTKAIAPRKTKATAPSKTKPKVTASSKAKATAPSKTQTSDPSEANATEYTIDAMDIGKIELLLAENNDANISATDGWTALHVAVKYERVDIVQLLIERNFDVNTTTNQQWTPLHHAAYKGHESIVRLLMNSKNVDINAATNQQWTPLHESALEGHENIVHMLLKAKDINVNATTNQQWTALHLAALLGHDNVLHVLLDAKDINVNAKTNYKWNLLHLAAYKGHESIAQILINSKNIDVNATTSEQWTPLHEAASKGPKKIVEMLLDNNADISAENGDHDTALIKAIDARQEDIAILLIQRGSPLIKIGASFRTPLYGACERNWPRVVKALVERGKSSGQLQAMLEVGYKGLRPLHVAASQGSLEISSQLVEAGADLNVRSAYHETPLIRAARTGQLQMMDYLITQGAKRTAKDVLGRDYLQWLKHAHPDKYEE